jgi:nucleoid-associated protein YgaU
MADARYIGSIVVENIKPKLKGEPSIELIISSTENGELTASAMDLDSSAKAEHLHLSVSLKSLDVNSQEYDLPDFELDQNESPPQGLYEKASQFRKREKKKKIPWIIIIIAGLVIILAALAFWFFLLRDGSTRPAPAPVPAPEQPARAPEPAPKPDPAFPPEQPARTAEPVPESASVPVAEQPAPAPAPVRVIEAAKPVETAPAPAASRTQRSSAPVSSYKVPAAIPKGGVVYRIRWGDTLWDISEAFYRNPWLYSRIARYNGIRNPDLIISGTTIRIPPKN